ncbi:hypothetical protein [Sphingomonas aracearum]|uniref:MobA-like NTP transferase domain-containing protein n=1 Tax=Sphingomonas aracearum TaxID=2283317 RepID=A0A369VSG3_9SPHN|nr:hypothetical protein [Sphingomonas aracearum]RDE05328.1 hypothetical protein DVW87_08660 [Sphingomonas aracearum]
MLAGLIFATGDAEDRPGALAATLPFGGVTLIEYQARLLVSAGAAQIIVVVARLTPELLGAINRIARRAPAVDAVRSAAEALEKLHPLARVLVLADGLVTTADTLDILAGEGRDALLVTPDSDQMPGLERVGVATGWAGLARVSPKRLADVASLPRDYDFQSTLLRVAAQAGAEQVRLPARAGAGGHGIERSARALAERGNAVLAARVANRQRWVERWVIAPVVRRLVPLLTSRALPTIAVAGGGALLAVAGLGGQWLGWLAVGTLLAVLGIAGFYTGIALAWLRDEASIARAQAAAVLGTVALGALLVGRWSWLETDSAVGLVLALGVIAAAGLAERASSERGRRRWWGAPAAYPIVMLAPLAAGWPVAALTLAALYAVATLVAAIETVREKP